MSGPSSSDFDPPMPAVAPTSQPALAGGSAVVDPIELYAAAIDTSDYVERVAPLIRRSVGEVGDLLDVGAGGGQLGRALRALDRRWTAIEPSSNMRARLGRRDRPSRIIAGGWDAVDLPAGGHDTVLAANIAAPLEEPNPFLRRCLAWSCRAVVWVVPAQRGPRGMCFAGCLPAAWHGEDETPGVDLVLRGLAPSARPNAITSVSWTFSGVIADIDGLARYLAGRLRWPENRWPEMAAHLARQARRDPRGYRLDIPRTSAVLVWRQDGEASHANDG